MTEFLKRFVGLLCPLLTRPSLVAIAALLVCLLSLLARGYLSPLFFVLLCLVFKILAIVGACAWLPAHHEAFVEKMQNAPKASARFEICSWLSELVFGNEITAGPAPENCWQCHRLKQLRGIGAHILPFGIMDSSVTQRIHLWYDHAESGRRWCGLIALFLHSAFFRLTNLVWLSAALLIGACVWDIGGHRIRLLLATLALVAPLIMAVEIAIGLGLMARGYARYMHAREIALNPVLQQLRLLLDLLGAGIAASVAAYVTWRSIVPHAFSIDRLQPSGTELFSHVVEQSGRFFYFATTTLLTVGFGDIAPVETGARLIVVIMELFSASIFIIVLQFIFSLPKGDVYIAGVRGADQSEAAASRRENYWAEQAFALILLSLGIAGIVGTSLVHVPNP